jgi:ABC-2 type transport system ATP-binding protein
MVEMRHLIREIGRGDRTVLLSSHLLNEVEQICDRIGVIQQGKLVAEGTVDEVRGTSNALVMRVQPLDKARQLLGEWLGPAQIAERDGRLQLTVDPGRAGELNRRLLEQGVEVSELRAAERSLEEVFLQLTEGSAT